MKTVLILLAFFTSISLKSYEQTPDWTWAKKITGNNYVHSSGITTDRNGNVIVAGNSPFSSITFNNLIFSNDGCFLAKYDSNANIKWVKNINPNSNTNITCVNCDSTGNIYITGFFSSSNFIFGGVTYTNVGLEDFFIAKLDSSGNELWASTVGGINSDMAYGVTTDKQGNILITGEFSSPTLFLGNLIINNTSTSYSNIFIAKLNTSGNFLWANSFGGNFNDIGANIVTDYLNNVYISGGFNSASIVFGNTSINNSSTNPLPNDYDIFIAKFNTSGNPLWAKSITNNFWSSYNSLAADKYGNVYLTGNFEESSISFGNIQINNTSLIGSDFFIVKYDNNGNILWVKSGGGNKWDYSNGISIDKSGYIYIAGEFMSPVLSFGNITLINSGNYDVFVVGYDSSGNVASAKNAIGISDDNCDGIATDFFGNIYITGGYDSPILTFGSNNLLNGNYDNVFIAKLSNPCKLQPPIITVNGSTTFCTGDSVKLTSSNAASYLWSNSATSQSVIIKTSGVYWVEISDTNGCKARDSIIINKLPLPYLNIGNDTVICKDQIIPFTINAGNNNYSYIWNTGDIGQSITVSNSGIYIVTATDINNCQNTDTIKVTFKPSLKINLGNDSIICPDESITLSVGSGYDYYHWSNGSTLNNLIINKAGLYSITVGKDGCVASDEILINECNSEIWLPNVFTPNEDGLNDFFYPVCINIERIKMYIYNRWGNQIFEGSGKAILWDGKYYGNLCPNGVYYYFIEYESKGINKGIKQKYGTITLLR